ncbi:MAG: hypothetical protein DRM99_04885 [Thermoplasmata archaeon]|nr:MAG: hypothetical protein DRM99_04885 [Thermoplasmata archaeon]
MALPGVSAQLSMRAPQDDYILDVDGNSIWKTEYPKFTNFVICEQRHTFQNPGFNRDNINCQLDKNCDLMYSFGLEVIAPRITYTGGYDLTTTPPSAAAYVDGFGYTMIERVKFTASSREHFNHPGEIMHLMTSFRNDNKKYLNELNGYGNFLSRVRRAQNQQIFMTEIDTPFSSPNKALVVSALYWTDLIFTFSFKSIANLIESKGGATYTVPSENDFKMYMITENVYLDEMESNMFVESKHTYLGLHIQYLGPVIHTSTQTIQDINIKFSNPIYELIWVCQQDTHVTNKDYFNYSGVPEGVPDLQPRDPFERAQIKFNNSERTLNNYAIFYRLREPRRTHTTLPDGYIYTYPFSPAPEDANAYALGTANFSRYDQATLTLDFGTQSWNGTTRVYALGFNFWKIENGGLSKLYGP